MRIELKDKVRIVRPGPWFGYERQVVYVDRSVDGEEFDFYLLYENGTTYYAGDLVKVEQG